MTLMNSAQWIDVMNEKDLLQGTGKKVVYKGNEIAVFKAMNGDVFAMENKCPHKGWGIVDGMISGKHVYCPMHDRKINMDSGLVEKPDTGCVQTFQTEVSNGKIRIAFPIT
ncbi:nitrite reductase small subunit NirD [Longirhabdus pacifica]|uniref:nitrite reductase small subunit NirD n=1 Tax=Longirhabdus pacifica TaxID=2305227 RepID=UPI001F0BD576|nr:nitrite reductase small subunit NirD [Longirhabdus pacifica]